MVSKVDIRRLAEARPDPAISLYLPVHGAFPERQKNAIRLRNLLRRAEDELERRGVDPEPLLARARRAFDPEPSVEGRGTHGLAVFLSADELESFALSGAPRERLHVGAGFDVLGLLPFADDAGRFYVLTLDQSAPALIRGDRTGLETVARGVMERSLAEIRGTTELPANFGAHAAGPGGGRVGGRPATVQHAQGESPDDYQQTELDQFAHGVARAAEDRLKGESAPLVPVGEPNLLGMFRRHCRYAHLTDKGVAKSPAGLAEGELHRLTLKLVEEYISAPVREAVARAAQGHKRDDDTVSLRPAEIRAAAEQGRVGMLLLARAANGAEVRASESAESSAESSAEARGLTAEIVRLTLTHRGEVTTTEPEALPEAAAMAALFRF